MPGVAGMERGMNKSLPMIYNEATGYFTLQEVVEHFREELLTQHPSTSFSISRRALKILIDELDRLHEAERWIPTSDRLPEDGTYLVARIFPEKRADDSVDSAELFHGDWLINGVVTHWQPLPTPPEVT